MNKTTGRFEPFKNIYIGINCIEKYCTKCKCNRDISKHFSRDPKKIYGYYSHCNDCLNSYGLIFRQRKLENIFDGTKVKQCKCGLYFTSIRADSVVQDRCQSCIRGKHDKRTY